MMKMLLILALLTGTAFAQNTPPAPPSGEGLQITLPPSLAGFHQRDAADLDVWIPAFLPDDAINYGTSVNPIFASEMKTLGRPVDRLFDRIQNAGAGLWWMFGHYDADAWYFNVQPNDEALTLETVGERAGDSAFAAGLSPLYRLYGADLCVPAADSDYLPVSLPPVAVTFSGGEGWANLNFCLVHYYSIGDGPECGGIGSTYAAAVWYNVAALTSDGDFLVTASIPLRVNGMPQAEAHVTHCSDPDDPNQTITSLTPAMPDWEAQGWAAYGESSYYPVLTAESESALMQDISGWLAEQVALAPDENALADVFAALNATLATLILDEAWIAQKSAAP